MDRNFFYQQHAKEQQAQLKKELATQNLLQQAGPNSLTRKPTVRIVLRLLPVAIALGILILFHLL